MSPRVILAGSVLVALGTLATAAEPAGRRSKKAHKGVVTRTTTKSTEIHAPGGRPLVRQLSGDITLARAVEVALRQNPDILRAIQEIERTRGQIIEVRAQALPHITATATYSQQDRRLLQSGFGGSGGSASGGFGGGNFEQFGGQTGGQAAPAEGEGQAVDLAQFFESLSDASDQGGNRGGGGIQNKSWRIAIEARQAIYAGGQIRAALNIARFTQDSAYFQLRDTVDRVISEVRMQFYAVLLNRALITVAEEAVRLAEQQLQDQRNRFEAGTVPRFNVLRAEVELANEQPGLIRARNDYLLAQLQLAKTLGLDPAPTGRPTFNVVGRLTISGRRLGLNEALTLARARRPFLKVQRQTILIEAEQIKVAMAGYKPRLDANAGYEIRNDRTTTELDKEVNGWFFGFTGSWDVFDGFETYGQVKQARARLESAKVNYDDSVRQVELEVQTAYARLQQARETIESQQKNVESALEALRLAQERLSAGAGTQLEVLDARVALTRARVTELQARSDYNVALAEFDRATATNTVYDDTFRDPLTKVEKGIIAKVAETGLPKFRDEAAPREDAKSSR
jgi:outer membrane protein